jgi:hypothetical protein
VDLTIPVKVRGCDTVLFHYGITNSSQGPSAAIAFLETAATKIFDAVEQTDLDYIQNLTGLPVTQLSSQQAGALVGAQLSVITGLAFSIPGLGIIIGAMVGWFADNIWKFIFPICDGPVATGIYAFSATQLRKLMSAESGGAGYQYGSKDDNPGVTSGGGCGDNSDYEVYWIAQLSRPTITLVDPAPSSPTAFVPPAGSQPGALGGGTQSPVVIGGSKFTVKGQNFPEGFVAVSLNGSQAGTPNAPDGSFLLTLTAPGNPKSTSETVTVIAKGGGLSASLSLAIVAPPK